MSDFEPMGNPDHTCSDACLPHEPLADRDLEDLEESEHIDALYAELNLVREHVAVLFLELAKVTDPTILLPPRSIAVLLDLSEVEAACLLGDDYHAPKDVVDHAIRVAGEDGYIGQAMEALFRAQLASFATLPDSEDDDPS